MLALEEFNALGVDFISLSESVDTSTPMGKMVYTVIAAVAELERSLIRERVVMSLQRAKAQGKRSGRRRNPQAQKRRLESAADCQEVEHIKKLSRKTPESRAVKPA